MIRIFCFLMFVVTLTAYSADEYTFNEYDFEWKVLTINKINYSVVKTQDRNFVQIRKDYSSLRLTASEAVEISKALSLTMEYFKKQSKTNGDSSNQVNAGEYNVTFSTSQKYGFSVFISDGMPSRLSSINMSKDEALRLQAELAKAESMTKFLNERITF